MNRALALVCLFLLVPAVAFGQEVDCKANCEEFGCVPHCEAALACRDALRAKEEEVRALEAAKQETADSLALADFRVGRLETQLVECQSRECREASWETPTIVGLVGLVVGVFVGWKLASSGGEKSLDQVVFP